MELQRYAWQYVANGVISIELKPIPFSQVKKNDPPPLTFHKNRVTDDLWYQNTGKTSSSYFRKIVDMHLCEEC